MGKGRYTLYFHLGISLFAIFPAILLFAATGSAPAAGVFIVLFNLLSLTRHHWLVLISYHVLKPLSRILGEEGFAPERMVISLSSLATLRKTGPIPPGKILLLLPHCLQNHLCEHRITFDPHNCHHCGKCPVGDLIVLADRMGIEVAIATGGTLARRHVVDKKPLAVVAVACPRDLGQGMLDAWPVPVFGIENARPFGDCMDTQVDIEAIQKAVEDLTS